MKRYALSVLAIVLITSPLAGADEPTASPGGFRAGIAVRVVTPDPLLPVSGGIGPSKPTTQKQGELTVRALVLADGDTKIAIVSADFLGFPAVLANQARKEIKGIPPENVLIGATHTHSAPDCYGFTDGRGATAANLKYLETVCGRMAEAVNEAAANLQPASLKIATGEAQGKIAYNYYAERLYDPRCSVIQAIGADGKPFATLVNYAIHPEVIGSNQGICSPDLIGPLYDRLQDKGAGVGIFMNGARRHDYRRQPPTGWRAGPRLAGMRTHRGIACRRIDPHCRKSTGAEVAKATLRCADDHVSGRFARITRGDGSVAAWLGHGR